MLRAAAVLAEFDKVPVMEIVKNVSASGGRRAAGGGHHQISALYPHRHHSGGVKCLHTFMFTSSMSDIVLQCVDKIY